MNKKKMSFLVALLVISTSIYSEEILKTDKGLTVDLGGVINAGVHTQTYKLGYYTNNVNGLSEDAAFFQLGFRKEFKNIEVSGHLRYGAGFETAGERTGGDMKLKYKFNDKFWSEYQKSDYQYTTLSDWKEVEGLNLGTGTQVELTPDGMMLDPVLSTLEVDYGTAFLGVGTNGLIMTNGDFTPDGCIWSAHMAYRENNVNHDLGTNALNFGYNNEKLSSVTSLVYANRKTSGQEGYTVGSTEEFNSTNIGATSKLKYKINNKASIGGGISYGDGITNNSNDSDDIETTILAQNIWFKTNIKGYDFVTEVAHSNFKVNGLETYYQDVVLDGDYTNLIQNRYSADKELVGAYGKISKFTKYGIPYLELKIAESIFDKANGIEYAIAQKNTLVEIKPGLTIPSSKVTGLFYGVNLTLGKYKSENIDGTSGNNQNSTQSRLYTNVTYVF